MEPKIDNINYTGQKLYPYALTAPPHKQEDTYHVGNRAACDVRVQ